MGLDFDWPAHGGRGDRVLVRELPLIALVALGAAAGAALLMQNLAKLRFS
jgi:hypothetical protein